MVKIHALKLVPGVNCCEALIARTIASLTKSSAWARLRVSDRAKARRCGSTSSSADCSSADIRSNAGSSMPLLPSPFLCLARDRRVSRTRLLGFSQLTDQLQHLDGHRLGGDIRVQPSQLRVEPAVKHGWRA